MNQVHGSRGFLRNRLGIAVLSALLCLSARSAFAEENPDSVSPKNPSVHAWVDRSGEPLPIQTRTDLLAYLQAARIVERKRTERGIADVERVTLENEGIRLRAALRSFDEIHRGPFEGLPRSLRRVRDAGTHECAAYELSEMLGIGRIPPTLCREVDGVESSLQIWIEGCESEADYLDRPLEPPDVGRWNRQKHIMFVFDSLIANLDRNQGNILFDSNWTIWFIDHSRAFVETRVLLQEKKMTRCSRSLWNALRDFDENLAKERLEPHLSNSQIKSLLARRNEIVEHFSDLISENGERKVLFEDDFPTLPGQ